MFFCYKDDIIPVIVLYFLTFMCTFLCVAWPSILDIFMPVVLELDLQASQSWEL